jgi:hypothetical protein
MMDRWGLSGMQSFEQKSVARKEGVNLENATQNDELHQ